MSKIILTIPRQPQAARSAKTARIDPVFLLSLLMAVILVCSLPVNCRFAAQVASPNLLHAGVPAFDE